MEYSRDIQFLLCVLAALPYGLTLFIVHEHFNWKSPRNSKLCDLILNAQIGATIFQGVMLVIFTAYVIYFRENIFN